MGTFFVKQAILLARLFALIGGVVLCMLIIMSVASIIGRALVGFGLAPVPGDYELVEIGTALAIFCFLPWCYLKGGHATVDLIYAALPSKIKWIIDSVSELLMLLLWLALTWMLFQGALDKHEFSETTFTLQMPIWWAYVCCLMGAIVGCLAYISKTMVQFGLAEWPKNWNVEEEQGY